MSAAWLLLKHSLRRVRTPVLTMGLLLGGFQWILIAVAGSIQTNRGFEQIAALLPPFARELMRQPAAGEPRSARMYRGGGICLRVLPVRSARYRRLTQPRALDTDSKCKDSSIMRSASMAAKALAAGFPILAFLGFAAELGPVQLTAQEDRQRLMDLLHITSLRQGANGSNPQAPNAANYDESKANPFPNLPDPLILKNGRKVISAKMWWKQRRPEIVEEFDREIYGRMPKVTPKVRWEVINTTKENVGGADVTTKQLVGHVDNSSYPQVAVDIQLALTTPVHATGPVPVVMEVGFPGPGRGGAPKVVQRAAPTVPTWQQQVLAKGWGYAVISPTSVQADNGAGLTQGIIGLVNKGQPRKVDDWGALRAWGWGASRALDYFATDRSLDAKRVALAGHSRYGKAALVAMAADPRFAVAFVSSSGEGGAKIHRRNWGELVENVAATSEYHWMAGNFLKYAGPLTWNDMPVDSHELVALCAPRPVFISAGATEGDGWVDAKGMFLAAAGAGPVYRLLGGRDMGTTEFPAIETGLMDGDIAFRQHSSGHTPRPNWPVFLTFAERYFK
jgi:hypothetical protein